MSTMNISLPDSLKSVVDEQVSQRGYGTSSEYVQELIRRDQDYFPMQKRPKITPSKSSDENAPVMLDSWA